MPITTGTLDKLYLEWSQFTSARTQRELRYEQAIEKALDQLKYATPSTRNGPCIQAIGTLRRAIHPEDDAR